MIAATFSGAFLLSLFGFFQDYKPDIVKASDEGQKAISKFKVPEGFKLGLFASEPMLANPIAFNIDNQNRVHVVEVFRLHTGAVDIRKYMKWLDDELALKNVEERDGLLQRIFSDKYPDLGKDHDRIRLIIDKDGDGKADEATVFADGFNKPVDGLAAGILVRGNKTYLTSIPDLWLLEDTKNQGKADKRSSLHHGFGVHIAFIGHDLHGLTMGPDGKIYFSVGDRGTSLKSPSPTIHLPHMGAVFRCDLDGSNLEVFHKGLRNPQELAFDAYGNLFTGDNNSDAGDQARITYLVPGGDSGWRCGYQYIEKPNARGPWNSELLWKPRFEGQSAYIIPPLLNLGSGPSGLTFYPGTGFDSRYNDHFFLCDFRGSPGNSGIWSFKFLPDGAGFKVDDPKQFLWSILCTDAEFGPDGALYVSDWVDGWNKTGKGRLYRLTHDKSNGDPMIAEVKKLLSQNWSVQSEKDLLKLLEHPNIKVRQEAHFALADKGQVSFAGLSKTASQSTNQFARIHAIWALGMIARKAPASGAALLPLLKDKDDEIRAQAARQLGELRYQDARPQLVEMLKDSNLRVQFQSALALSRIPDQGNLQPLLACLEKNADKDAFLRHGCVMGLAALKDNAALSKLTAHPSSSVRMGAVLALRNLESVDLTKYLKDGDPRVQDEAARAIADLPIENAYEPLAQSLENASGKSPSFLRRAMAAARTIASPSGAEQMAKIAASSPTPREIRMEALWHLENWHQEMKRDFITGQARITKAGSKADSTGAIKQYLGKLLASEPAIAREVGRISSALGITEITPTLVANLGNTSLPPETRRDALIALEALKNDNLNSLALKALKDPGEFVRAQAISTLGKLDPEFLSREFPASFDKSSIPEQQAWIELLGESKAQAAKEKLTVLVQSAEAGMVKTGILLEIMEAGKKAGLKKAFLSLPIDPEKPDTYAFALEGGDASRGRAVFFEKTAVSCLRCHKVSGQGGDVGPDLNGLAAKQNRAYLLEAIVNPNKQIAKGYDSVLLTLSNGKTVNGIVRQETDKSVSLMTAEGKLITIPKQEIDETTKGKSAMPSDVHKQLSPRELRDLLEFLAGLR